MPNAKPLKPSSPARRTKAGSAYRRATTTAAISGATMERPALQRLLADIDAGHVDCVVTYKVDRLSRSLLDFARLMETFDKHQVSFVSVTQQFNTAQSMGRLVLNVLLSFAQFEREIISERTRDKMAATRRKGKWTGGRPLLGYDLDPLQRRLVVNPAEAARVLEIFALFLKKQALWPVVKELHRRGWRHKAWTTRAGIRRGGEPFSTVSIQRLLTNPIYVGKVGYQGELHDGEHPAIIDTATWHKVQTLWARRTRPATAKVRSASGALLQGLLYCGGCGGLMTPTHTSRNGKLISVLRLPPHLETRIREVRNRGRRGDRTPGHATDHTAGRLATVRETCGSPEGNLRQRIERVDYDGAQGRVAIRFHDERRHGCCRGPEPRR